jgi:thiazole synthase
MSDPLIIAGREFGSRLFLGTAGYPNRKLMLDSMAASATEMVTASIRRISLAGDDESLVDLVPKHIHFLPNTAGCQTAKDAVLTAELAREARPRCWWRRVSRCCPIAPRIRSCAASSPTPALPP